MQIIEILIWYGSHITELRRPTRLQQYSQHSKMTFITPKHQLGLKYKFLKY